MPQTLRNIANKVAEKNKKTLFEIALATSAPMLAKYAIFDPEMAPVEMIFIAQALEAMGSE